MLAQGQGGVGAALHPCISSPLFLDNPPRWDAEGPSMHGSIQEFLQLIPCHPHDSSAVWRSATDQQLGGKDRLPREALRSHLCCSRAVPGESPDQAPEGTAAPKSNLSNKLIL